VSKEHLDKGDRLEQHCRRLGTHEARCVICGVSDPRCLEEHHIAGRGYHDDTAIVCRNCHRKLSDDQLDHAPRDQEKPTGELATIGHFLLGVCDFLLLVIERLREFGYRLINESRCVGDVS
jgi:hypothetical protein